MKLFVVVFVPDHISPGSLSRPCCYGLHHLSLVPPAHALWQHLIHRWVCHPAGPESLHSSRGPGGGGLLDFRLWHREGINLFIPHTADCFVYLLLLPFPKYLRPFLHDKLALYCTLSNFNKPQVGNIVISSAASASAKHLKESSDSSNQQVNKQHGGGSIYDILLRSLGSSYDIYQYYMSTVELPKVCNTWYLAS